MRRTRIALAVAAATVALAASPLARATAHDRGDAGSTAPTTTPPAPAGTAPAVAPIIATFDVSGETFRVRFTDPEQIGYVRQTAAGTMTRFPAGVIVWDETEVNIGYSWHLERARMVEAAIEVCDGRPHDLVRDSWSPPTYCPWGAEIVAIVDDGTVTTP